MLSFGIEIQPAFVPGGSPEPDDRSASRRRAAAEADRGDGAPRTSRLAGGQAGGARPVDAAPLRSREVVLPLAKERESVASAAHASGTLDLVELFAMRLEVKEVELERLDLERRLALVDVYLALEYGEAQS